MKTNWISKTIVALLAKISPKVIRALKSILQDEVAELYAECKGIFMDAVRHAETTVTKAEYPEFWERAQRRVMAAFNFAFHALGVTLGRAAKDVAISSILTCIHLAHKEWEIARREQNRQ